MTLFHGMEIGADYPVIYAGNEIQLPAPGTFAGRLACLFLRCCLFAGCEEILDNHPRAIFQSSLCQPRLGDYQDAGFPIDTSGNIRSCCFFPSDWNYPDSEGYISAAEMDENLAQLGEAYCMAGKHDLAYFAGKTRKMP
ncbi:MAG: hypothetical protein MZV63_60860 [Marinilabiliales bacterium]|nr:hypothetical protein [Marinilabiliales bacterium]